MGAHFEALDEGVLLVPLDPRYTQVGFNLISVQVCLAINAFGGCILFQDHVLSVAVVLFCKYLQLWTRPAP